MSTKKAGIPTLGQLMELVGTRLDNPAGPGRSAGIKVHSSQESRKRKERSRRQDGVALIPSPAGPRSSAAFSSLWILPGF